MFDMRRIGAQVAELRKAENMTQMELADRMNISFQAVSNWERGNSMPDISKLPELAQIFGVTIDELLGEKSNLLISVAEGRLQEYLDQHEVSAEQLGAIGPVLKPDHVDIIFQRIHPQDLDDIVYLAPFLSGTLISELARQYVDKGYFHRLDELAPFIEQTVIDEIAATLVTAGQGIAGIIPFVSSDVLGKLAEQIYEERGLSAIAKFYPFLTQKFLQGIADREYAVGRLGRLTPIAPFLEQQYLNKLVKQVIDKEGLRAIVPLAPFLDNRLLSEYIKEQYL